MISISHITKNLLQLMKIPLLQTWYFIQILQFLQCVQNTKQFISVDSPSCAGQNGTNDFVIACTVVKIFLCGVRPLKARFLLFLWISNSTNEHNTIKLIASFHSESTAHCNDMTWRFIKILPFSQCAQNTKQFISIDSSSWAKQNGTNDFVIASMVVEIFLCGVRPLKAGCYNYDFEVICDKHTFAHLQIQYMIGFWIQIQNSLIDQILESTIEYFTIEYFTLLMTHLVSNVSLFISKLAHQISWLVILLDEPLEAIRTLYTNYMNIYLYPTNTHLIAFYSKI